MKVLHLISGGDTGGAKTHVYNLLSSLKEKAHVKVVVFIDGEFYRGLLDLGVNAELLEQKSRFDLKVLSHLQRMIHEEGFDIVHSHGARANFIAWRLKRRISCPVVTTIHSDYLLDFDGLYKKIIFTGLNILALGRMDYYIAVSRNFKDMMIARGYRPNRIFTVYNGMNFNDKIEFEDRESFAKRIGIQTGEKDIFVGIIGRHDHVKGHDIFLRAAKIVADRHDNVRFVIAGGEGSGELRRLAGELGISDKVVFAGFVDDIYSFINFIDINVLTSRSESFPYVLLEGARLKKPTVSSAVGGIPDLIEDVKTGLLFENGDYEEAARQICKLIEDRDLCKVFGENLHKKATTRFSGESLAESHIDIYKRILKYKDSDKEYDVCLSGYYGFNNSGDDALLFAILEGLNSCMPDIRVAVLSARPRESKKIYRIDSKNRFNIFSVISVLKSSKMLINGGGSLIQDATSSQSLWYYTTVIRLAKRLGAKVYLLANGIGPVSDKNLGLAAKAVNLADMITLRDNLSLLELRRMGALTPPVKITADPAVALDGSPREAVSKIFGLEGIPDGGRYIGISVRPWNKSDEHFAEKIASAADFAAREYGLIPVFIPMKYPDDLKYSQKIMSHMKCASYVLKSQYGVHDMIGVISSMDLILGMRLHTLIFAAGSSVPAVGLIYDPKVSGFMDYIKQSRVMNVEDVDTKILCGYIAEILDNMDEIKKELVENSQSLRRKAMENAEIAARLLTEDIK